MNKNRKFLIPLAALVSMFTTSYATANVQHDATSSQAQLTVDEAMNTTSEQVLTVGSEDLFKFVLKRNELGNMMAYHHSHQSHSSHASHSSHRSHYSGY